ncbi:MAG TPA: YfiR family protein [Candidatus Acidoferrum sp.]|nr:YfiR family protein [Candidatus Acidoferrum sp.]
MADIFAKLLGARSPSARLPRRLVALVTALAMVAMPSIAVPAQEANEQLLKVAFIYNFAKFTTWPDSVFADAKAPITFCVVGKHEFGNAFDSVQGKSVGGRTVVVKYLSAYRDKDDCQVVYVAPSEKARLPKIVSTSKEVHALTVSDLDGFGESCGIIRMVRGADDRIGFEINVKAAEESGLKLSSKLLNLAKRQVECSGS